MKIGDLVIAKEYSKYGIGIILEIKHYPSRVPDYRNPTSLLIHFPENTNKNKWFYKNEIKLVSSTADKQK
tara:strand:- start:687 stop:896 length:210 start_codon:yes stop_codon:yes gene_type:complete